MCRARDPIFSPEFPFRSISFSQITKKSVPEHHHFTFFGGFCRSGDHHFPNFFNFNPFIASHGRLSPNAAAPRVSGRSGDSHFHAQNGSSSFRSPTFSRSTGSSFRSPCPFFTLPRHIPTKIWGEYPPPPGRSTYLPKCGASYPPPPPRVVVRYYIILLSVSSSIIVLTVMIANAVYRKR